MTERAKMENWNALREKAEYTITVKGNDLAGSGLFDGDLLFCDYDTGPAHLVVAVWGNTAHICREGIDGELFLANGTQKAPPEAMRFGRVLWVQRQILNQAYLTKESSHEN